MLPHPDDGGMRDVGPFFYFPSYIKTRMLQQHSVLSSCEQFEASSSTRAAVINMPIDHQAAASTMSLLRARQTVDALNDLIMNRQARSSFVVASDHLTTFIRKGFTLKYSGFMQHIPSKHELKRVTDRLLAETRNLL